MGKSTTRALRPSEREEKLGRLFDSQLATLRDRGTSCGRPALAFPS